MWKPEHRAAADRRGLRYESDLTDAEWALVGSLIPPAKRGGRPRTVNVREVLNVIFYVLWTGEGASEGKAASPLVSRPSGPSGPPIRPTTRRLRGPICSLMFARVRRGAQRRSQARAERNGSGAPPLVITRPLDGRLRLVRFCRFWSAN